MIREFPVDYELIGLFEAEPLVSDRDAPWLYNTLDFTTNRNGIEVHCRLVPSYGKLTIRLMSAGNELALFELRDAEALRVVTERQQEALVVTFLPERRLDNFLLQLKPYVKVAWGNLQLP